MTVLWLAGCIGPKYVRPDVPVAENYAELPGEPTWQPANPSDGLLQGRWWEVFGDERLDSLEEELYGSNQQIVAAQAGFEASKAVVREARSNAFPTVSVAGRATGFEARLGSSTGRSSGGGNGVGATGAATTGAGGAGAGGTGAGGTTVGGTGLGGLGNGGLGVGVTPSTVGNKPQLLFDASGSASWTPDIWGKVRGQVRANAAAAQASAADLENARLTAEAQLAMTWFQLRVQDALQDLLNDTVVAYGQSAELARARYETGIDTQEALLQAETQLATARAQATDIGVARAQYVHLIATLIGQPASDLEVPSIPLDLAPPAIPVGVPSQLLERRPDISAAERAMAQANARIGVAETAWFPSLTLSGTFGFATTTFSKWFTWPTNYWSVGPALAQVLFEGGLRKATVQQFKAQYDQSVATYRQTVLTAFQQVEDQLAALRILHQELEQQEEAVDLSKRSLAIALDRYRIGLDPYLNVITAQTTLLGNQRTLLTLRQEELVAAVQLAQALGGGWDTTDLPGLREVSR